MLNINEIDDLIKLISKLPGLGPKSAKRIVLKLINNRDELVKPMANTLAQVYKNVTRCSSCGSLKLLIRPAFAKVKILMIKFVLLKILLINGQLKVLIYLKVTSTSLVALFLL